MQKDFFINLERQLNDQHDWPTIYMFKFIIPADNHKLAQVEALFGEEAVVTTRQSRTNKFISVTAKEMMMSADKVIETYKKATKIEGIISL